MAAHVVLTAAVRACTQRSHYAFVPRGFFVPWGQGPAVPALLDGATPGGSRMRFAGLVVVVTGAWDGVLEQVVATGQRRRAADRIRRPHIHGGST